MKIMKNITMGLVATVLLVTSSCDKYVDINVSPNSPTSAPIAQVLTSVTVNVGFRGGSDMHRYTSLIAQQFAGQGAAGTQSREYARYQIQPTDVNNLYSSLFATQLADIEYIIANSEQSPHYRGVARILKGYVYSQAVDMWGDLPFSEAFKSPEINQPKLDDDEVIYTKIIELIDQGITDIKATSSALSPGTNETIFQGNRTKWERLANTLKLRLFLRYSAKDATFAKTKMDALISSSAAFLGSNADNFQMSFVDAVSSQNSIHQFEISRPDQFFPNKTLVDMMNTTSDPRRSSYFTDFPFGSGNYKGASPLDAQSFAFSRLHTFLRGALKNAIPAASVNSSGAIIAAAGYNNSYSGSSPVRLLTFAEYNFIRAEHALRYGTGAVAADVFFKEGIKASMSMTGVSTADQDAYILANGSLNATTADGNIAKIIKEKYIANYGVALEPWNDWRRTGYPTLQAVDASVAAMTGGVPRSLFYPDSEVSANTNFKQKANMLARVFWDTRP
ncbi:SusD/RagB family nutrient-binding outer membrane lipoprotein [Daejeonella sp.]|jgi:hypothetical protein|uniref:SusD/RagB family nutrient-binding outer membrane lipoprotein n=1 Tax=Daejeonella sp. TaxID=2805397 RepID=UPI0037833DA7